MKLNLKGKFNHNPFNLIFYLIVCFLGFGISYYTKTILPFLISVVEGLIIYSYFRQFGQKEKTINPEKTIQKQFFKDFYIFSTLTLSYQEGIKETFSYLPISTIKEQIDDYLLGHTPTINISISNDFTEQRLLDLVNTYLTHEDEPNKDDINEYLIHLKRYLEQ